MVLHKVPEDSWRYGAVIVMYDGVRARAFGGFESGCIRIVGAGELSAASDWKNGAGWPASSRVGAEGTFCFGEWTANAGMVVGGTDGTGEVTAALVSVVTGADPALCLDERLAMRSVAALSGAEIANAERFEDLSR